MRKLILRKFQSPGDILMLTAAVRDLHRSYPGEFLTDVRTSIPMLWEHNPYLTSLDETDQDVTVVDMNYPLIYKSNSAPYHFIHGFIQYLENALGLRIPITEFRGDVHLTSEEKRWMSQVQELGVSGEFWIIIAGGKYDFTAKWWNPERFQQVVDHFRGRIQFVQCGHSSHWHPRLENVIDLVGKTDIRQFVRLMYHASGVLCPVTFAMHLAAAVETKPGQLAQRPCVVVAGGREPPHWEAYPHHQFLSTIGALDCCASGGCWRCRCQLVGDNDRRDYFNICESPVQVSPDLRIPRCMDMITSEDVIRRIELYLEARDLDDATESRSAESHQVNAEEDDEAGPISLEMPRERRQQVLMGFLHGLGDVVQFTIVLNHTRKYRPDWDVDVVCQLGRDSALAHLCRRTIPVSVSDEGRIDFQDGPVPSHDQYDISLELDWPECHVAYPDWPSTKVTYTLRDIVGIEPEIELFRYDVPISEESKDAAVEYLSGICQGRTPNGRFPAVVIHYQGRTSGPRKDLSHDVVAAVCEEAQRCGFVPVILDWDGSSPLPDQKQIFCPDRSHSLWSHTGRGDAEQIAALIQQASLMIGIDSGPLHVAGATTTPTIGVWHGHHPIHFFDLSEHVLHLVPTWHSSLAAGPAAMRYFQNNYLFREYEDLSADLCEVVRECLNGTPLRDLTIHRERGHGNPDAFDLQYYLNLKDQGCDYAAYGDWQRRYGSWLVDCLDLRGKTVLDVGCACGMMARGLQEAGSVVVGTDCCEEMIQMGRRMVPELAGRLFVADAANLHYFCDNAFDCIHLHEVTECWKPSLVKPTLSELARVAAPEAMLFCVTQTPEQQKARSEGTERHSNSCRCVRPVGWWHRKLAATGWRDCSNELRQRLYDHELSFLREYDWTWFVARREE